jgi:hypothetical protein
VAGLTVATIGAGAKVTGHNNTVLRSNFISPVTLTVNQGGELKLFNSGLEFTQDFRTHGDVTLGHGAIVSADRFFFEPTANTTIHVAGRNGFGTFATSGSPNTVTINGGTLNVGFTGGFSPALGDSYAIVTAASRSGTFANINLPDLNARGLKPVVEYPATGVNIKIQPATLKPASSGGGGGGNAPGGTNGNGQIPELPMSPSPTWHRRLNRSPSATQRSERGDDQDADDSPTHRRRFAAEAQGPPRDVI